jgi:Trypsin-co-occurring domain 2
MADEMIPLHDAIRILRAEIVLAAEEGTDKGVQFRLGPIDLEFSVVATREGGPNGKIKFSLFGIGAEAGGSAKFANERTQKVKLTLTPFRKGADGSPEEVDINRVPRRPTSPRSSG